MLGKLIFIALMVVVANTALAPALAQDESRFFYDQIRTGAQPTCAQGATGLTAITNCLTYIINQLKPLAAVLLVIAITISGAYLVFSPLSPSGVETAKTIFIWACIGFVIVFSADLIRGILHELAGR